MANTNKRVSARINGDVMTADDVAEYLRVSRQSVVRLFKANKIPAKKVGVLWRCLRPDVDRFMTTE